MSNAGSRSQEVSVWRQEDGYLLECHESHNGPYKVYSSTQSTGWSEASLVATLEGGQTVFINTDTRRQYYFHCVDASGEQHVTAERHIPLTGTPNFRDYGGYKSGCGRRVRWGKLFRSSHLSTLTEDDLGFIEGLDIKLVCDFRRDEERSSDPARFPESSLPKIVGLPIDPGSTGGFVEHVSGGDLDANKMADFMCGINRQFALAQTHTYREMFEHLLDLERGACVVNCAAGKDRTGFAVAMILSALGVDRECIIADYMLTSQYFCVDKEIDRISQKYQWQGDHAAIRPMLETREDYLRTAFDAIDQNFSTVEIYLEESFGLGQAEREHLKSRYLV